MRSENSPRIYRLLGAIALMIASAASMAQTPAEPAQNLPPPVPGAGANPFKPPPAPPPPPPAVTETAAAEPEKDELGALRDVIDLLTYVGQVNGKTIYAYKKGNCYVTVQENEPLPGDCYRLAWNGVRNRSANP